MKRCDLRLANFMIVLVFGHTPLYESVSIKRTPRGRIDVADTNWGKEKYVLECKRLVEEYEGDDDGEGLAQRRHRDGQERAERRHECQHHVHAQVPERCEDKCIKVRFHRVLKSGDHSIYQSSTTLNNCKHDQMNRLSIYVD